MCKCEPMKKEDLLFLLEQPMNAPDKIHFTDQVLEALKNADCVSGIMDGEVMICAGISPIWNKRAHLWCLLNTQSKRSFVPVFRAMERFLNARLSVYNRLEICVPHDFKLGRRRAELLGFTLECARAEKFLPDGTDCAIYALVRR